MIDLNNKINGSIIYYYIIGNIGFHLYNKSSAIVLGNIRRNFTHIL